MENVNVYICTYHEEGNIADCIKAVKDNNVENIYIVDASENDLTEKEAIRNGAKVIKASKGLAGQRQIAIDHCDKEYLMFVDADDRLDKYCIKTLLKDMKNFKYNAVQARLRVLKPSSYWQKGMDANLKYCICKPGKTNMVGRPALYRTEILKKAGMDLSFNNKGNEDSALSIRLEKLGAKQGVGYGIAYRYHPKTYKENYKAWRKYGYGDANLIKQYPEKTSKIIKHVLYIYPIKRSWQLIIHGKGKYIGYTILTGWVRFIYLLIAKYKNK